ncbi:NUDIX domain-containing protein [Dyadobacter psychrotolerans]|uniref:NUDIX domain-containing protein n=1 Tax=Dyadobacter psychrotolerans TaxID=2541721 RepID=A0A4R5DR40_9BACT|nr:NUDIX domain-containing protein [Dyadobacter psychrotolerans]TDE16872.1 NUDIX domain-containing protein [Dyadobacter psychrotolerans]
MKQSAGILLFRNRGSEAEVFLVHPGGPFFARKDAGWWTVPKGEFGEPELPLQAAIREFEEETGLKLSGEFLPLAPIVQKAGKKVYCWAIEGNMDASVIVSNTFEMEWPPKSGKTKSFPEIDKAAWFDLETAKRMIMAAQISFLDELLKAMTSRS